VNGPGRDARCQYLSVGPANGRYRLGSVYLLAVACLIGTSARAQYHPEHPKVVEMVNKGVEYLTNNAGTRASAYGAGETILAGYACYKVTGDIEHVRAKEGLAAAVQLARSLGGTRQEGESKIVYEATMAVLMLAAVDPVKYRPELNLLLDFFFTVQKKQHGGFGYLGQAAGDTSQTQYAMLALWTLNESGIEVPQDMMVRAVQYLSQTQEPNGGWAYQYELRNGKFAATSPGVTKSLSTAGIGALIVGADTLRVFGERKQENAPDDGLPTAFKRIDNIQRQRAQQRASGLTRADLQPQIERARSYQNKSQFAGGMWYYYWRYSEERYESFAEIVEGKQNKSPAWYNEGVEELARGQDPEGSWGSTFRRDAATPIVVDTSFAILYLIRSTQKSIGSIDSGLSFGGYELPSDVSKIKMVGDRIVSDAELSVENLLGMLESDTDQVQMGLLPDDLQLSQDPTQRREQVNRLSRLLSSRDAEARRVAARLLGRSDDLDQAPELIYALTDPDPFVPRIAEESLRLLSRKLNSGKLGAEPTSGDRAAAEAFWKNWYLGLRPDYQFAPR
jgi:hypothetical protein